jgi:hypothetical protein
MSRWIGSMLCWDLSIIDVVTDIEDGSESSRKRGRATLPEQEQQPGCPAPLGAPQLQPQPPQAMQNMAQPDAHAAQHPDYDGVARLSQVQEKTGAPYRLMSLFLDRTLAASCLQWQVPSHTNTVEHKLVHAMNGPKSVFFQGICSTIRVLHLCRRQYLLHQHLSATHLCYRHSVCNHCSGIGPGGAKTFPGRE